MIIFNKYLDLDNRFLKPAKLNKLNEKNTPLSVYWGKSAQLMQWKMQRARAHVERIVMHRIFKFVN